MKLKVALTGLLISLAVAAPVVAGGLRNHMRSSAISVADYNTECPPPDGMFANWNRNRLWTLTFGDALASDCLDIGLRIDAPSSLVGKTFQFDVNTSQGNTPYMEVWVVPPGLTGPVLAFEGPFSDFSGNGFTQTTLNNGFTRLQFNAANSDLDPGTTFSSIYFADFNYGCYAFQDQITNAFLNGTYVPANIQPQPEFDSTLDFD